ncbi:MAG: PLP-dependent cysteine synthase family protein [Candidatus Hodarchaeales archaeon]|jgi:cysteine synthase A
MGKTEICNSIIETIGKTPLVELSRLTENLNGRILAKVEFFNPGFSKKDRIALQTIEDAEQAGILKPGQTIIELTSGNTGTGYAVVCAIKEYPFVAVMSKGNSIERARMMAALGAKVVLVDQAPGSLPGQVSGKDLKLVETETQRLTQELSAFRADQFELAGNWRSHYFYTGEEIIKQTEGQIDAFCDFVGTGGSFVGITKKLKEYNPNILCFIVEPENAAVLAGKAITNPNHKIQGGGYSMTDLKFLANTKVDGYIQVSDAEAIRVSRRLAREEGIFAGFSSGANVAAAIQLLKGELMGKTIACLMCDSGLKYLSTDLWELENERAI